jgi:opacity protein-like surface antigen
MKPGMRLIAILAVAFLVMSAPHADLAANTKAAATNDEPAASVTAPIASAEAQPTSAEPQPKLSSKKRELDSDPPPQGAGKIRGMRRSEKDYPRVEWFLGYSYWRAMPTSATNRIGYLNGGSTSVAFNLTRYFGLVADFGGYANSKLTLFTPTSSRTVDANGSAYTYTFGPRFSYRRYERFTPFAQALFGGAHATAVTISGCSGFPGCAPLDSANSFAALLGAGFDIKITRHVALRLVQADYLLTHSFSNVVPEKGWQNNVRLSSGIVFRFGGGHPVPPPENHPPTASCSTDKSMVYLNSGDSVGVTAMASDPDNDPLNYAWSASGGSVDGAGSQVRWLSAGTTAGSYTVTAHIDDGHGGTAACSADIRVEPKPNRPPTITCSADRSLVFAGERIHITCIASDPDGDPLTYTWHADAGKITGNGPSGDFDTTGLSPATYPITTRVDDGRGGTAEASTPIGVKPVPPPPQASKINECMFGKPLSERIDNVCKRILDDVALRLQNDPRATTVIIGYSDPKERKPNQVAGDRAANAVKYLAEKGIDTSRATTRTGSGQADAGAQNRRIDVIWVPEGATY